MTQLTSLMNSVAKKFAEDTLGVKMTNKQFDAYCDELDKQDLEDRINQAISLLRNSGYTVRKMVKR